MIKESIGKDITDIFDFFIGTSAGSINIGGLLTPSNLKPSIADLSTENTGPHITPRYSLDTLTNDLAPKALEAAFHAPFLRKIRTLFGLAGTKYSAKPFEQLLQEITSETNMSDLVKPAIITSYDFRHREVFNFSTFDACKDRNKNYPLWKAMRASSAAPVYYKPLDEFLDGKQRALIDAGLFVMSPALLGWIEMYKMYPNRPIFLLSISSGFLTDPREVISKGNTAGNIPTVLQPTIETALEGQAILTDLMLKGLPNVKYHRLTFKIMGKEFDDISELNIKRIKEEAQNITSTPDFMNAIKDLTLALKDREGKKDSPMFKCETKPILAPSASQQGMAQPSTPQN